jgi:hypothetical protein
MREEHGLVYLGRAWCGQLIKKCLLVGKDRLELTRALLKSSETFWSNPCPVNYKVDRADILEQYDTLLIGKRLHCRAQFEIARRKKA